MSSSIGEPTVSYSLKEIVDQINQKLDTISTQFAVRLGDIEVVAREAARVVSAQTSALAEVLTRVDHLEQVNDIRDGGLLKGDRIYAKAIGLAGVFGGVAGVVIGVIKVLFPG